MKRPKPVQGLRKFVDRHRPAIKEVVREPTAGGIVFRRIKKNPNQIQILLIQDAKDRWTIPKGHIEEGESSRQTAEREIREETGIIADLKILTWLGKINFRYRRQTSLVLMTTEIFLIEATGDTDTLKPEAWMNGIRWFNTNEALDKIEYEDIGKLILVAMQKIRSASTK